LIYFERIQKRDVLVIRPGCQSSVSHDDALLAAAGAGAGAGLHGEFTGTPQDMHVVQQRSKSVQLSEKGKLIN